MKLRPYHYVWALCGMAVLLVMMQHNLQKRIAAETDTAVVNTGGSTIGGAFTLTDQDGKQVTDKSFPGKYQLIYFGFTHCPDVCPLGLNRLTEALNTLPAATVEKIQPIFVTVDPARDTAADLKIYVDLFHPKLIGLTGSEKDIERMKSLFRVYAEKQGKGKGKDYMINHSAFTYLMNPDGKLAGIYSHDSTAASMAKEIEKTVK